MSGVSGEAAVAANKAVSRRLFEAMTRGDLDAVDDLFTPDATVHDPGRELRGVEPIKAGLASLRAGFPDIAYTVESQIADEFHHSGSRKIGVADCDHVLRQDALLDVTRHGLSHHALCCAT